MRAFWRRWHALMHGERGATDCSDRPPATLAAEERGRSNYLALVRNVLDSVGIKPGEVVLKSAMGRGCCPQDRPPDRRCQPHHRCRHQSLSAPRSKGCWQSR